MSGSVATRQQPGPRAGIRSLDTWLASRWILVLIAIILVAVAVRIALAVIANVDVGRFFIAPDSFEYDRLGVNLATGNGFSQAARPPFVPDIRRTPVYPLVLASLFMVEGHRPIFGAALGVVFGVLTCVLTAELGRAAYGWTVGAIAGLLLAADEVSAVYSLMLMTETLFTVLILLVALNQTRYVREGKLNSAIISAAWTGVAILTRPIALFLPLLSGPILAWIGPRRSHRGRIVLTAVVVVGMAFPLTWTVRNYLVSGLAQPTSLIAINGYYYRAAPLEGNSAGENVPPSPSTGKASAVDENPAALRAMEKSSVQIVLANPLGYATIHALGVVRMLGPDRDALGQLITTAAPVASPTATMSSFVAQTVRSHRPETSGTVLNIEFAQLGFVYALAIVGSWASLRQGDRSRQTLLLWSFIGYFLAISGPEAYPRFRVPIMPFISILAALGLRALWPGFHAVIRSDQIGLGGLRSVDARVPR